MTNKPGFSDSFNSDTFTLPIANLETEMGSLEVTGTGNINVRNTGGSSASEGGMGSDSDDDKAKGDITKPGGKSANTSSDEDDEDITFDPIKKSVREAEKKAGKD